MLWVVGEKGGGAGVWEVLWKHSVPSERVREARLPKAGLDGF